VITLDRVVPTALTMDELAPNLASLGKWPLWHYNVIEVRRVSTTEDESPPLPKPEDGSAPKFGTVEPGALLRYTVDPKGQTWKRFFIYAEVTEYVPGQRIVMRVRRDSKGRLLKMLRNLEWRFEFTPADGAAVNSPDAVPVHSLIHGEVRGETANWRGRIFAGIARRILLHQALYADLQELSYLKEGVPRPPRHERNAPLN
jgi:hypothetical protein